MNENQQAGKRNRWLNRTVLGVGLASLFSDWSHEIATTVMPTFLATLGVAAAWLGIIEGVSDGLSSFAKLASGYYTDKLRRRKPFAALGYMVTALGTASFALATSAWHVLVARAVAWLGRGARTPVRKALLAAAVTPETYGRAFGFERMMDTIGALVGPATAMLLLGVFKLSYPQLFAATLIPGMLAAFAILFLVKETERRPVPYVSFRESLKSLPSPFRRFLAGVGLFGLGDFAHTFLILLAVSSLKDTMGETKAAATAAGLYLFHNLLYASFSMIAGYLADKFNKRLMLSLGYALGALMTIFVIFLPMTLPTLVLVFGIGGIYVAMEETLEDSLCAELVKKESHGMGFGVLATVNGIGDFLSSVIVGFLWTAIGVKTAFAYSTVLFIAGALIIFTSQFAGQTKGEPIT